MRIFRLHKSLYKLNHCIAPEETYDSKILEIKKKIQKWCTLKKHGLPDNEIAEIVGMSRAMFYRHKRAINLYGIRGLERRSKRPKALRQSKIPDSTISLILRLRVENPTYGKAKIAVILKRDHSITSSESTVGRVITKLLKQGKIQRSVSSLRIKRKRTFKSHAKPWVYGMKAAQPGQMVQIDHMSVTKHNVSMKEFRAWDPITKVIVADVVSNATSAAAAKFLQKVRKEMPFPVQSIQVQSIQMDGGSEFMKNFEDACCQLQIPLFVLPPSRPQWNGGIERANRTFREEVCSQNNSKAESIGAFKNDLRQVVLKYNSYRPHFNLKGLTPCE